METPRKAWYTLQPGCKHKISSRADDDKCELQSGNGTFYYCDERGCPLLAGTKTGGRSAKVSGPL